MNYLALLLSVFTAGSGMPPVGGEPDASPSRSTLPQQDRDPARVSAATIATHYFYWYRWPSEHFGQPGAPGPEGHCRHFPAPETVSYLSADWHRANFAAMASAGIDVALPVYWGAPGAYDRPNLRFARAGLPPMVQALDALAADGAPGVKLGLFYDTTTLNNGARGVHPRHEGADLTTGAGRALFCDTVVEYFAQVPRRHWARHRGGALVVLYSSGFAARWDRGLGDAVRAAFAGRFAEERLCLVADASWGDIGQDLTTQWGAALDGPKLFPGVAQIGPGYDDRPVPGRRTPVREREDGAFYVWSWQHALRHGPELVLLETWNEMHEGTELCETLESGSRYMELTREWVRKLRHGEVAGPYVVLRHPEPRQRPDHAWGVEAAGAAVVFADFAADPVVRHGLRELAWEDGPVEVRARAARAPGATPARAAYLYFQVSDHFAFDVADDFVLEVTLAETVDAALTVQYDARSPELAHRGAYRTGVLRGSRRDGAHTTLTFALSQARLANRQNGGSDLRLWVPSGKAAVTRIALRRSRG